MSGCPCSSLSRLEYNYTAKRFGSCSPPKKNFRGGTDSTPLQCNLPVPTLIWTLGWYSIIWLSCLDLEKAPKDFLDASHFNALQSLRVNGTRQILIQRAPPIFKTSHVAGTLEGIIQAWILINCYASSISKASLELFWCAVGPWLTLPHLVIIQFVIPSISQSGSQQSSEKMTEPVEFQL